jgi:hypothetical protein
MAENRAQRLHHDGTALPDVSRCRAGKKSSGDTPARNSFIADSDSSFIQ